MKMEKRSHYNRNGVETKNVIRMVSDHQKGVVTPYQGFCIGNIIKYVMRFPFKDEPVENLKKAQVYINYLIQDINRENQKRQESEASPDKAEVDVEDKTEVEVKTDLVEIKGDSEEINKETEPTKVYIPKPSRPGIPEFYEFKTVRTVEYP